MDKEANKLDKKDILIITLIISLFILIVAYTGLTGSYNQLVDYCVSQSQTIPNKIINFTMGA